MWGILFKISFKTNYICFNLTIHLNNLNILQCVFILYFNFDKTKVIPVISNFNSKHVGRCKLKNSYI